MEKKIETHDYRTCKDPDCQECQELIDYGLIMACDDCDYPGSTEADSFHLLDDGRTLCDMCFKKLGN